jgi:hypothetical protein
MFRKVVRRNIARVLCIDQVGAERRWRYSRPLRREFELELLHLQTLVVLEAPHFRLL